MAEEKLQYQVTFKTRAEGDGAQKTAAAVRDLTDATNRLNNLSTVQKLGATEFAYYDLGAEIDRTKAKTVAFAATANTAAAGSGKMSMAIGQAGFQVQDFAVQVGAGQNAMVAFAQQGSQLLGMFGPGGAVAGALLAVGAIAYNTFSKMGDDVASVMPQGDKLKTLLGDIANNAEAASAEEIDFALDAMKAATTEAEKLRDRWRETNAAADAYEASQMANQEKIRQAFVEYRRMRGEQIDELAEIQTQEAAAAAQRQLSANQEATAAQEKATAAGEAARLAQEELVRTGTLSARKQEELTAEREKLAVLREQRDELQRIADNNPTRLGAFFAGPEGRGDPAERERALKQLADQGFQAEMAATEGRVAALEAALEVNGDITAAVLSAAETAAAATVKAADVAAAVEFETGRIADALQAETVVGQVEEAAKLATATADEIKAALPQLETVNAEQVAAKESLTRLASDGQITVNETAQALRDLQTLFQGNTDLVTKMISFMQAATAKIEQQDREIATQKQKIEGLRNAR